MTKPPIITPWLTFGTLNACLDLIINLGTLAIIGFAGFVLCAIFGGGI